LLRTLVALSHGFWGESFVQTATIDAASCDFRVLAVQIRDASLFRLRPASAGLGVVEPVALAPGLHDVAPVGEPVEGGPGEAF
jgi:hypothetical protein